MTHGEKDDRKWIPEDTVLAEKPKGRVVESTTELSLAADQVWDKMKMFCPEQQQCLKMKIEGYSYEETAVRTGLSVEAVRSHLQNGRRMLWLKMEGMLSQLQ